MSAEVLPATLLSRKAVVYVRQSTQTQVQTNLESKRRQYDLVEAARRHGFASVELPTSSATEVQYRLRNPATIGHSRNNREKRRIRALRGVAWMTSNSPSGSGFPSI